MSNDGPGAPEGNSNNSKHDLYADREKLFNRLTDEEKALVGALSTDLLEKVSGEVGAYEREAIRNICVDVIKRRRANDHIVAEDITQDGGEMSDRKNKVYSRIVRDTTSEMEKLGLLEDGPEMKKAEAQEGWMSQISDAKNDE